MGIIKTTQEGWECVPELQNVVEIYENVGHHIYEINHCVRAQSLEEMVGELLRMCVDMKHELEQINEYQEFETVFKDED
tara:strand:- start:186 stop:422 length:237 start_codon:yes stop_codon:yes gene_type:complete